MKTSNRLLLGILTAIVVYFSVAFVELRVKGDYGRTTYNTDSVALPVFNHLVIKGLEQQVYIEKSDAPMITTRTIRENPMDELDYVLEGDTLIINSLGLRTDDQGKFTILTGSDIRSLRSVGSYYHLTGFDFDSLSVQQEGGRGGITNCDNLAHLNLSVKWQGEFDAWDLPLESVNLNMVEGNVELRSPINTLSGSMKDNSYLRLSDVLSFQFQKDASSNLKHY